MKKIFGIGFGIIVVLGLIIMSNSFYIVKEDEVAVVKNLGKKIAVVIDAKDEAIVTSNIEKNKYTGIKILTNKGLQTKIPFIETVQIYSAKYLTYISNKELINTKDERRIEIQMYAQYRILDPIVFDDAVGNTREANKRMDENVYKTVINSANTLKFNEFFYQNTLEDLLQTKQEALNQELTSQYGLFVSDIGINHKSFPDSNIANIEEKMAKEIEKESDKLKAEGDSEFVQAQAITERQRTEIVSAAVETAAIVKAEADAEAIRIYQESLQKDLAFYQFITRMEIYKNIKDTTVFLDGDNAIFNLLDGYEAFLKTPPTPVAPVVPDTTTP